jgi:hypothetical protein
MNIHGVSETWLSEIKTLYYDNGTPFYTRSYSMLDKNGQVLICITQFSDNGYNLLIVDADLDSLTTELPLIKAA